MIRYSHKGTNPKGYSKKANPINPQKNHQILLRPKGSKNQIILKKTDDTEMIQSGRIRKLNIQRSESIRRINPDRTIKHLRILRNLIKLPALQIRNQKRIHQNPVKC